MPLPNLSLPKIDLSISTPAPIIGSNGIIYKPGQYTTLTNPGLVNPYLKKPSGKTDMSLTKPSEIKLDRTKSEPNPTTPESKSINKKTMYIAVGVIVVIGAIILLNNSNENK